MRQREDRDEQLARVAELAGEEQLEAAVKAVEWLREHDLTRFYGERLRPWEALAARQDPTNAAGRYEAIYEASWLARSYQADRMDDPVLIEQIVGEFDQWRRKFEFHDPDRAVRMHLYAGFSMFRLGQQDAAGSHIDEALKHKPKDQKLVRQLQALAQAFRGEAGSGTGFVAAPGYILTNYHVVQGAGRIVVMTGAGEDHETAVKIVAQDEEHDLALLKVDGPAAELPALRLSDAEAVPGDRVATFGYPGGGTLGEKIKFSAGAVSSLPEPSYDNMYLLDLRVNPGNSGGPLFDQYGRVIGMIARKSRISEEFDSYALAIPGRTVQEFLRRELPDWTPPDDEAAPRKTEWSELYPTVSKSVLMVVRKR
jgi:S1-C subfamily serine protease